MSIAPHDLSGAVSRPAENVSQFDELQLRVARRADELASQRARHTALDLDCWLLAEAEVLRATGAFPERK